MPTRFPSGSLGFARIKLADACTSAEASAQAGAFSFARQGLKAGRSGRGVEPPAPYRGGEQPRIANLASVPGQ
jgi:hypothetical protein